MGGNGPDPAVVRVVVVSATDLVTALEASRTTDRDAVLRMTPPFSGRMRARLHVSGASGEDPGTVHVDPDDLVGDLPSYPAPDDTEDRLREESGEGYSIERHRRRHVEAVEAWREAVVDAVRESARVDLGGTATTVRVAVLGVDSI